MRVAVLDANAMAEVAAQLDLSNGSQQTTAETQREAEKKGREREAQSGSERECEDSLRNQKVLDPVLQHPRSHGHFVLGTLIDEVG